MSATDRGLGRGLDALFRNSAMQSGALRQNAGDGEEEKNSHEDSTKAAITRPFAARVWFSPCLSARFGPRPRPFMKSSLANAAGGRPEWPVWTRFPFSFGICRTKMP